MANKTQVATVGERTNKRVWYGRSFKGYGQHSPQRFPERRKQKWMDDYF